MLSDGTIGAVDRKGRRHSPRGGSAGELGHPEPGVIANDAGYREGVDQARNAAGARSSTVRASGS
jgi:hypothetical protein